MRVCAHGGGVQSTAMLVLSAQGKIDFPTHLFCNTGDDSEHPDTLNYVRTVSQPWAKERGIDLIELHRTKRDGSQETLMGRLTKPGARSLPIPVRYSATGPPVSRACTSDFKIRVMAKWMKERGADSDNRATVAIGISVDELERAHRGKDSDHERRVYPLIDLGLHRSDCHKIIRDAGLPTPPKSACFFCPFHRPHVWAEMARDEPDLFAKACDLEEHLTSTRVADGKEAVFLTRFGRPLRQAIGPAQDQLFPDDSGMDDGECDEGVCFV